MNKDIEALSHLAALKHGWSESRRLAVSADYEAYIARAAKFSTERPSRDVDELWHLHILNTTSYVRYCEQCFGRYVHHIACVAPELVDDLKARLGGQLPVFMPEVEHEDAQMAACGAPDCGPALGNCGSPAQCSGNIDSHMASAMGLSITVADCSSAERNVPPLRLSDNAGGEIASAVAFAGVFADCGSGDQPPETLPSN